MSQQTTSRLPVANSKWFAAGVIAFTLLVLAGTILVGREYLRERTREQMAGRDAQILYALWRTQFEQMIQEGPDELAADPAAQFLAMLDTSQLSQLKEFRAARLYDSEGNLELTEPVYVVDAELRPGDLAQLRQLRPVTRFYEAAPFEALGLFALAADGSPSVKMPLLEVVLPIHADGGDLLGAAQFILDGAALAAEFAALDRSLWLQSALAFGVSGSVVALVLGFAFRNLQLSNRLLSIRTESLLRANQELALAAKTTAVGAVTSHLIHGLKNPLSGLQSFISSRVAGGGDDTDREWETAISTARRMQNLVSEVVRVLREENSGCKYELTLEELAAIVESKTRAVAEQAQVVFRTEIRAEGILANRSANLVMLILENLIQNAIQATPKGKSVALEVRSHDGMVGLEVRDQGPGIPETYREQLFKPCTSTKEKGSGIGLAISKQLANYLGAELNLKSSSHEGSVFILLLPATVFIGASRVATAPGENGATAAN